MKFVKQFSKASVGMTDKRIKECLINLAIRKMQNYVAILFHPSEDSYHQTSEKSPILVRI